MIVNGETRKLTEGCSLGQFLELEGYKRERIAVELNGEILPKSQYDATRLSDSDKIEIVQFMGGG